MVLKGICLLLFYAAAAAALSPKRKVFSVVHGHLSSFYGALRKRAEQTKPRQTQTHSLVRVVVLVIALPKPYVSVQDFYREFHLGLCLGAHKNIVTTYDVAFETSGFYVFTQEYAPLGKTATAFAVDIVDDVDLQISSTFSFQAI